MTTDGSDLTGITKSIKLPENVTAPVKKGNTAGKAVYSLNGTPIGSVNIVYADTVDAADYKDYFAAPCYILFLKNTESGVSLI